MDDGNDTIVNVQAFGAREVHAGGANVFKLKGAYCLVRFVQVRARPHMYKSQPRQLRNPVYTHKQAAGWLCIAEGGSDGWPCR